MNLQEFYQSEAAPLPHFLLVGNPVAHSFSPLMHNAAAAHYGMNIRYTAVQLQSGELSTFASCLNKDELRGVNITIPYKQSFLEYVDETDEICRQIGAINTISKTDYKLRGHNTDVPGFLEPLQPYISEIIGGRALVFGTGGAARAVIFGLLEIGMEQVILVSRNPAQQPLTAWPEPVNIISYDAWPAYADEAELIINTTPLGMAPHEAKSPVKNKEVEFLKDKICYDIVYRPLKTAFLKQAEEAGAQTIGGLDMLIHQGSRSFELWTGKPFPIKIVRKKLHEHLH